MTAVQATRRCAIIAACAIAAPGAAEPLGLDASMHARIGSVAAPFMTAGLPEVRSTFQAYALIIEAGAVPVPGWRFGARVPIATSSIEQPAGSYTADYTLGNPEVHVDLPPRRLGARVDHRPRPSLAVRLALGLPVARHDPAMIRDRVLAASDAVEGWRDRALFQPGMMAITAAGSANLAWPRGSARAQLKLPVLVRVTEAGLPEEARPRPLAVVPVVEGAVAWHATRWLALGLAVHAAAALPAPIAPVRDVGRSGWLQLGAAARATAQLGRVSIGLELLAALGGPLAGSVGLGLDVGFSR